MQTAVKLYTAEDLLQLPADEHYELIRGALVPMPPSGWSHGTSTHRLSTLIGHFVLAHDLGECTAAESGFVLSRSPDTVLAPDFAFVRKDRLPDLDTGSYAEVVPDLVAETKSRWDSEREVAAKVALWLSYGVKTVWAVDPRTKSVTVHRQEELPATYSGDDVLSEPSLLPGWSIQARQIFG